MSTPQVQVDAACTVPRQVAPQRLGEEVEDIVLIHFPIFSH